MKKKLIYFSSLALAVVFSILVIVEAVPFHSKNEEYYYDEYGNQCIVGAGDCFIDLILADLAAGVCSEEDIIYEIQGGYGQAYSIAGYERFFAAGYLLNYIDEIIAQGGLYVGYTYTPKTNGTGNSGSGNSGSGNSGGNGSSGGGSSSNNNTGSNSNKDSSNTGGSSQNTPPHEHSYTATVTTPATCTDTGVRTFTCTCGDSYTEEIPMLEHNYTVEVTREPACEKEGEVTYTCACGDTYTEIVPKTGHKAGDWKFEKKAGRFTKGKMVQTCKICNKVIGETEIPETVLPMNRLLLLIGAVILVLLGGGIGIYFYKKKRK